MRTSRKFSMSVIGGLAAVVLAAGPVAAHECYNASRSDKGNQQIAAHSAAFVTFDESATGFFTFGLGLCPAGVEYLLAQVHLAAAQPDSELDLNLVVGGRSLQAGGIAHSPSARAQANLSNGTGIDLLGENAELGAVIGANIGTAAGICA